MPPDPHQQTASLNKALKLFSSNSAGFFDNFWEFFSFVGFGDIKLTEKFYAHLDTIQALPWQQQLIDIGRAKFLSITGHLFKSHQLLQKTSINILEERSRWSEVIANQILAFLSYEQLGLAKKVDDPFRVSDYFHREPRFSMNKKFQAVITLQEQMTKTSKDSSNFMQLERAIWRMEEFGAYPIACVGWRNAGIAARSHKQYTKATAYFEKALGLAKQFSIELMVRQTQLSIAVLNFHTNEPELAREQLDHIRFSGTLDPVLASKYEILTLLEVDSGNMELAMEHLKKALDISLELDHIVMVPDQCLYLGETYENHFHDLEKAEHYYRIGQEHSLRYAEHGISLTGDRKKVVDGHLRLLSSTTRQIAAPKKAPDYFSFAAGKSWRTIKDIFQHQLILYHSKEISKGKLLAAKLSMPPTTLYSLKTRLLERGYELVETTDNSSTSQHPAQEFIHEHNELSWAEINKIFEQEMIHYLYEKYGYNKHRMANILELSYPAIINKTRELTQVNEHFLPN